MTGEYDRIGENMNGFGHNLVKGPCEVSIIFALGGGQGPNDSKGVLGPCATKKIRIGENMTGSRKNKKSRTNPDRYQKSGSEKKKKSEPVRIYDRIR